MAVQRDIDRFARQRSFSEQHAPFFESRKRRPKPKPSSHHNFLSRHKTARAQTNKSTSKGHVEHKTTMKTMPNQPPNNDIIPREDPLSAVTNTVVSVDIRNGKSSIATTSRFRVRSVFAVIAHRRTSNFRKVHPLGIKSRATFQSLKTVSEENYPEDGHVETTQQQIESCIDLLSSTDVD